MTSYFGQPNFQKTLSHMEKSNLSRRGFSRTSSPQIKRMNSASWVQEVMPKQSETFRVDPRDPVISRVKYITPLFVGKK